MLTLLGSGTLAQLAEHPAFNRAVSGSTPESSTKTPNFRCKSQRVVRKTNVRSNTFFVDSVCGMGYKHLHQIATDRNHLLGGTRCFKRTSHTSSPFVLLLLRKTAQAQSLRTPRRRQNIAANWSQSVGETESFQRLCSITPEISTPGWFALTTWNFPCNVKQQTQPLLRKGDEHGLHQQRFS